jgi:hypothetical protein
VKVFGRRPLTERATGTGPAVRKPARDETAAYAIRARSKLNYGDLTSLSPQDSLCQEPHQGLGAVKQPDRLRVHLFASGRANVARDGEHEYGILHERRAR